MKKIERKDVSEATLDEIDTAIEGWYSLINKSQENFFPKIRNKTINKFHETPTIRNIKREFKQLWEEGQTWGWDMVRYTRYKELKQNLTIECLI